MNNNVVFLAQAIPEGRLFGLDEQTLISIGIQLLNGIALAAVLGFLLYIPVKNFMQKRSDGIRSDIEDAKSTMSKANELIEEYNAKLRDIESERLEILEDARKKADDERKEILQQAKDEAFLLKKRSLDSIADDKKRHKEESRLYIIEIASLMAKKYIAESINSEDQNRLFDETLAKMENTQWQS